MTPLKHTYRNITDLASLSAAALLLLLAFTVFRHSDTAVIICFLLIPVARVLLDARGTRLDYAQWFEANTGRKLE